MKSYNFQIRCFFVFLYSILTDKIMELSKLQLRNTISSIKSKARTKTRNIYISSMNFIRVKLLEKTELDTPEKRLKESLEISKAIRHYEMISNNIKTCYNNLQVTTIENMTEMFKQKHGHLCMDKYTDLRESLNHKKEELCINY